MKCETCKYYVETEPWAPSGLCHRYPPSGPGDYPTVYPEDWCGEYAANPTMNTWGIMTYGEATWQ